MNAPRRSLEETGFNALDRLSSAGNGSAAGALMDPLLRRFEQEELDWARDAEFAIRESNEAGARGLLYLVALALILLVAWAANAPIDEVTRGEGTVIPASRLQIVQSEDGGVVRELLVQEGDRVEQGELLARIDPTRYNSSFREAEVRIFALQAKVNRLNALLNEEPWQPETSQSLTMDQLAVTNREKAYYVESRNEYQQRLAIAREQLQQKQQSLEEARARAHAGREAVRLSAKELAVTRPLLESGAISEVEILRLERDLSAAKGERQQAEADVERQMAAVEEARAHIKEVRHNLRNKWRSELSNASSELRSLEEGSVALADRVRAANLRAPVAGTVQRVLHNTQGAVVKPGEDVIELVPADDRLLVEARIAPRDIAFLRPGLPANIKLHAYDFSIYGGIPAHLKHISADTVTDERDNTYYLVEAITDAEAISDDIQIMPGMTAQLDIITGERSVLSYLLKPILRAKANAMGER